MSVVLYMFIKGLLSPLPSRNTAEILSNSVITAVWWYGSGISMNSISVEALTQMGFILTRTHKQGFVIFSVGNCQYMLKHL